MLQRALPIYSLLVTCLAFGCRKEPDCVAELEYPDKLTYCKAYDNFTKGKAYLTVKVIDLWGEHHFTYSQNKHSIFLHIDSDYTCRTVLSSPEIAFLIDSSEQKLLFYFKAGERLDSADILISDSNFIGKSYSPKLKFKYDTIQRLPTDVIFFRFLNGDIADPEMAIKQLDSSFVSAGAIPRNLRPGNYNYFEVLSDYSIRDISYWGYSNPPYYKAYTFSGSKSDLVAVGKWFEGQYWLRRYDLSIESRKGRIFYRSY